ncbi:unnamed protein product [Ostreobium quekettii]|uniref:Uncharacterized protein n=1 Tax=Ostreobium quekettii TaxID=121088 RepID=A0A8S1IWG9_9CHLO|nr:unnamed protein product [Ostreobium quekettii]|eukprot:evm.model.scf_350.5 EVM.evm.TU.scf_350.5   scf_350:85324-87675(-)
MVDQRRRRGKDAERKQQEFLRQVSSQMLQGGGLKAWGSFGGPGGPGPRGSVDSLPACDDDLVYAPGMMGLDPGKDALLLGQSGDAWGGDLDADHDQELIFGLPSPSGFPPFAEPAPGACLGCYTVPEVCGGLSPFDGVYGMPMEECKPDVGAAEGDGMSVDVKVEGMELDGALSPSGCLPYEILTREQRAEVREARRGPVPGVDVAAMAQAQRVAGRSKGVTMCLRTLLRQLLAGTGWIMDSSISKDHATHLIRQLVGPELDVLLEVQLTPRRAEAMASEDKELHYSKILGELVTRYVGQQVTLKQAQDLIKRDKGPYHLTQDFIDMLRGKEWPPCMLPEKELRRFGCYRQGEASKRTRHD